MEPVKEGPSWAICQLGVRGYQGAAVHGDGQALRGQESTGEGHGEGAVGSDKARSPPQVMLHYWQEPQHCQGTAGQSMEH